MHVHKRGNTYIYRRRVPVQLQSHINLAEFHRALVPDIKSAKMIASKYDLLFSKIITSLKMNINISNLVKELDIDKPVIKPKVDIYDEFLKSKENIAANSYREYKQQLQLFKFILPTDLYKLSYSQIDTVKKVLLKLPKRNIQRYRDMSLKQLIKEDVATSDRISTKSQNEYLKTLRALLKFAHERDYIDKLIEVKLFTNKTTSRNQREALSKEEVGILCNHSDPRVADMSKILYYSGMRLSEVYKCTVGLVEGVLCFDLSDKSIDLKTHSSYRIIPVHNALKNNIKEVLENATSIKDKRHSRMASEALKGKSKTLYSLRHTFATELAARGIETGVISELLGHSHKGMTLCRYIKGFPTKLLSESINKLDAI